MGTTFSNFHVRTEDVVAVQKALEQIGGIAWIAAEPRNGWVSVYPYRLSLLVLMQTLTIPLINVELYDDDIAMYQLFENGVLVVEYDSYPDDWIGLRGSNGDEFALSDIQAAFEKSTRDGLERAVKFVKEHHPDAFSTTMELFRVLGLEKRFVDSGHRVVLEKDFPLLFVGEELLTQEELSELLMQSIPDIRIVPTLGKTFSENPEANLAAMRKWLSLGASPDGRPHTNCTPLIKAVEGGCVEAVKILLEGGASPSLSFAHTDSCAHQPVRIAYSSLEFTKSVANAAEIRALLKTYEAMDEGT